MEKTVLITGASRGIGRATAFVFAENGYNVIINCKKNQVLADKVAQDLQKKYKVKTLVCVADVGNESEVLKMIEKSIKTFGKIDVLVNNAGIFENKEFNSRTVSDFENTLKTNLIGPFILSKHIAPFMLKNKYGKIINVSSNNSFQCFDPVTVDYDVSKAGLNLLTRIMAVEYAPYINVNAVAPGWVKTDMCKDFPKEFVKDEEKNILKRRFGEPEDVANLIYFLASDKADYITGEIYRADGGYLRT